MSISTDFEEQAKLTIVYRECTEVTESSLEAFRKLRRDMGVIQSVFFLYEGHPDWHYYVYLVNEERKAWVFDGFAWGYGGTGPRGFLSLLDELGWCRPRASQMPESRDIGCWELGLHGIVYTLQFPEPNPS